MKMLTKLTLMAVTLATATSAHAYTDGELLLGFKAPTGVSDFILNLGTAASLFEGKTWNVGAGRTTEFGVIGILSFNHIGTTSPESDLVNLGTWDPSGIYGASAVNVRTVGTGLNAGDSKTTTI